MPFLPLVTAVVLLQVGIAFFGHNLVHAFERYAFLPLSLVFVAAMAGVLARANLGQAFNPTAPLAPDDERLCPGGRDRAQLHRRLGPARIRLHPLPAGSGPDCGRERASFCPAPCSSSWERPWPRSLGNFAGCAVLEIVGAALVTVAGTHWGPSDNPTEQLCNVLPGALPVLPWRGVMFTDYWLCRGDYGDGRIFYDAGHNSWSGVIAFLVATIVSVGLFASQALYTGPVPKQFPQAGDLTFLVGFVLAVLIYAGLHQVEKQSSAG